MMDKTQQRVEFFVDRRMYGERFTLYARKGNSSISCSLSALEEGMIMPELITLESGEAQALFDELYLAGLRPSGEAKKSEAREDSHIADLRAISFKLLGIKNGK